MIAILEEGSKGSVPSSWRRRSCKRPRVCSGSCRRSCGSRSVEAERGCRGSWSAWRTPCSASGRSWAGRDRWQCRAGYPRGHISPASSIRPVGSSEVTSRSPGGATPTRLERTRASRATFRQNCRDVLCTRKEEEARRAHSRRCSALRAFFFFFFLYMAPDLQD